MLCQICGKSTATVHYTEVVNSKMTEIHVCQRCADEKGLKHSGPTQEPKKFDIAEKVAEMVDEVTSTDEDRIGHVQCPSCSMAYSVFKESGRLGCAECYEAFQFQLRPLLRRIHGDTRHRGKVPAGDGEGVSLSRQIQRLHDELQRAVEKEDFERAAEIRDEIQRLEAETESEKPSEKPS